MTGGLIVSEYPEDSPPQKWTFPRRNRIVAGLSSCVLIVEAADKSGSLITANLALDYNRNVLAIPGSIFSSLSIGTNDLISKGAYLVRGPEDVLNLLELNNEMSKSKSSGEVSNKSLRLSGMPNHLWDISQEVIQLLNSGPMSFDELLRYIDLDATQLTILITELEMHSLITFSKGLYNVS